MTTALWLTMTRKSALLPLEILEKEEEKMLLSIPIQSLLTEQVVLQNHVTGTIVTSQTIQVHISPPLLPVYVRPDCCEPVIVNYYDTDTPIIIQGLGVQGKAVRYVVERPRMSYINDEGRMVVFTVPVVGIRSDIGVTLEVVDRAMYFIVDCNISLPATAKMLQELYQVSTSSSALGRWKIAEAEALPSIGRLIQLLNEKKKITALHLDEYKATGTKSWELVIGDEHGRLLFSIKLEKRDEWHIKVILRWLRILGLEIKVVYVDFWLAYPPAIKAIFPQAEIQFDFFHVIQNIHRHLYRAFTVYRKKFYQKSKKTPTERISKQIHKELWKNRYLFFTNDENLSDDQRKKLDELLAKHEDTILQQIVDIRTDIRHIFNESVSFTDACEKLTFLVVEDWANVSSHFGKIMTFLQENFKNMLTYLRVPGVNRNSLSECTVRSLRRIEKIRQGFKKHQGRINHLKLLQWRKYLRPACSSH